MILHRITNSSNYFMYLQSISDCTETHYDAYGWIKSPNYPRNYPTQIECNYYIYSPSVLPITINFVDFEVEARSTGFCYDYVKVRNFIFVNRVL